MCYTAVLGLQDWVMFEILGDSYIGPFPVNVSIIGKHFSHAEGVLSYYYGTFENRTKYFSLRSLLY